MSTKPPRAKLVLQWAVISVLVLAALGLLYAQYALPDGIRGLVLPVFFPDTTVYAPNFQEDAFRKLGLGVDKQEVIRSLGPPLERDTCEGLERWRYSQSASDSHYRVRELVFENESLAEKTAFFLVD